MLAHASVSNDLVPFLACFHWNNWIQHVTGEASDCTILDLIFTAGLACLQISNVTGLPGYGHLPIGCSFILPLLNRYPYLTRGHISVLAGVVYLVEFVTPARTHSFLTAEVHATTGRLYSNLHKFRDALTPSPTPNMLPKEKSMTD